MRTPDFADLHRPKRGGGDAPAGVLVVVTNGRWLVALAVLGPNRPRLHALDKSLECEREASRIAVRQLQGAAIGGGQGLGSPGLRIVEAHKGFVGLLFLSG